MDIRIYCENVKSEITAQTGTALSEIAAQTCKETILSALVDN